VVLICPLLSFDLLSLQCGKDGTLGVGRSQPTWRLTVGADLRVRPAPSRIETRADTEVRPYKRTMSNEGSRWQQKLRAHSAFAGQPMGPADHKCDPGQARIATEKPRDRHDHIIVQEKLDGTNVGVARIDGALYPLVRAGYVADTSPFQQHWRFAQWVYAHQDRFLAVLRDGERLVANG